MCKYFIVIEVPVTCVAEHILRRVLEETEALPQLTPLPPLERCELLALHLKDSPKLGVGEVCSAQKESVRKWLARGDA